MTLHELVKHLLKRKSGVILKDMLQEGMMDDLLWCPLFSGVVSKCFTLFWLECFFILAASSSLALPSFEVGQGS